MTYEELNERQQAVVMRAAEIAEAHIKECDDAMFAFEEGDEMVESPAMTAYDACPTCMVREIIYAALPVMVEAAANGELTP